MASPAARLSAADDTGPVAIRGNVCSQVQPYQAKQAQVSQHCRRQASLEQDLVGQAAAAMVPQQLSSKRLHAALLSALVLVGHAMGQSAPSPSIALLGPSGQPLQGSAKDGKNALPGQQHDDSIENLPLGKDRN